MVCCQWASGWCRQGAIVAPALEEIALLADYLAHQLFGGRNLGQALSQAGQEAVRTPPTPTPYVDIHVRNPEGGAVERDLRPARFYATGDAFLKKRERQETAVTFQK